MKESKNDPITGNVPIKDTMTEAAEALPEVETDEGAEEESAPSLYPYPYYAEDNCLYAEFPTKNGVAVKRLCNFVPRILTECTVDDGVNTTKCYRIGGTDEYGSELPPVDVPAAELEKMAWMQNYWKASCDLCVVPQVEKHVRFAIKSTSKYAEQKYTFAHTGWKKVDGEYRFLLPGNPLYDVQLKGKSRSYAMTDSAEVTDLAYLSGFLQLDFIPREIMYPCLALVFLSPLNTFLRCAGCEPKFLLTLIGRTGSMKSTVAALMLSFFGHFTATELPMSFRDTGNSILYNAGVLTDVLTCVDDYHPTARRESENMRATVQMLIRAYGDRATRERLTSDITLRESHVPHGNVIVTAEYAPDVGESGTARMFCIEMKPKQLDTVLLTEVQELSSDGLLMRCMYRYLKWMKEQYLSSDDTVSVFIASLKKAFLSFRTLWREKLKENKIAFHDRLPDTLASLEIGFSFLLKFLKASDMLDTEKGTEYKSGFESIMLSLAVKQAEAVSTDKPTRVYISKLMSLIESGEAVLLNANSALDIKPRGFIGYEDENYYYVGLDQTHKMVSCLCNAQNEMFSISTKALAKALYEEGLIERTGNGNTHTEKFKSEWMRVMTLRKDAVKQIAEST